MAIAHRRRAWITAAPMALLCVMSLAAAAGAQTQPSDAQSADPQYWFGIAVDRLERKDNAGAIEPLQKVLELVPDAPEALQNLGQAYQNLQRWEESAAMFARLAEVEPENWRARAKLVQNYQALGQLEHRDRERQRVFEMWKAGLVDQAFYAREQFVVGDLKVWALEYFEMTGDRAVRYSFAVVEPEQQETLYRISLGSYEATNEISRQLGNLKPGVRLFHLDGYYGNREHKTFAMYEGEPTYEQTRADVVAAIDGRLKEISSTKATTQGAEIKVKSDRR